MSIDNDECIEFSLSQKDTLIHKRVTEILRPEVPLVTRMPKKTRLERMPLSKTTSAMMRVIKGAHVERLSEYFEQTCDRRQHETAIICGSSHLTYQELDHRANRLAHLLISRGVGKGSSVGILLERSLDTYITLLGVLKAGAVFVPLDPSYPSDLVAFIAEDAGLRDLVTTFAFREKTSALSCPVLELDQEYEALSVQHETRPQVCVDPASLCYIIYTLDTTGRPKGIAVSHANVINFLRVVTPIYRVMPNDRVYQGMSTAFGFSFEEIWPTWTVGATLVAGPPDSRGQGHGLTEFLIEHKITVLCCTPKLLATIESEVPFLRTLLVFGEVCPADLVSRWLHPGRRMLNTYGLTETTLTATWSELFPGHPTNIGFPLPREYASAPQFESEAIFELEASRSKLGMLNQIKFKNIYKHIMTDPLYKNSIFNMASTFILGGLGFVFWIIIARLYKTENVGIATTLISIMTLLSSFTIMGLNSSLTRYLPQSANKNELINSSFVIVTIVTLLASFIFLLGLQIFSPQLLFLRSNLFYIISFTTFLIFCSWNVLVESIFIASRAAGNILIKNIIISILKLLLPFVLIAFGAYGIFASTASALALGVLAGLIILIFKFKIRPSISFNVSLVIETSIYSLANYIVSFTFIMPSLVLPVIILNILSAKFAAYYYIASMIQNILLVIPLATAQALLAEGSYNEAELKKHVKKAIATTLVILIPATAIIVFSGKLLLQFFGKNYATEAFQLLQLYSASIFFTALLLIGNAILNVKHKIRTLVLLNVMAAIFTLCLSCAFISGKLVGIGWGWTLGQAIAGLVSIYFIIHNYSGTLQSRASPSKVQEELE